MRTGLTFLTPHGGNMAVQRGEIWVAHLDPTVGHEQRGRRPCVVVSPDSFNTGFSRLVVIAPITSRDRGWVSHIGIEPGRSGLRQRSWVKLEDIRAVSPQRLLGRVGTVSDRELARIRQTMRDLLDL